jgi:uncharacterized peroxidase-related enzyme
MYWCNAHSRNRNRNRKGDKPMADFPLHDEQSAPELARQHFPGIRDAMGFVPNVFRKLAEEPAALEAYLDLDQLLDQSVLTAPEKQVALLAASRVNLCHYCVAAHSGGAKKAGVDGAVIKALRDGRELPDAKLEAVRAFTERVVEDRGFVSEEALQAFLNVGYTPRHVIAVILAVTMKTLSNYTNHIAEPPLDEQLKPLAWQPAS